MSEITLNVIGEMKENSLVLIEKGRLDRAQRKKLRDIVNERCRGKAIFMLVDDPRNDVVVFGEIKENSIVLINRASINRKQRLELKETIDKRNWSKIVFVDDPKNDAIILDEKQMNENGWYRK